MLFCPEDLFLIRAGAVERRRFLDDTIASCGPDTPKSAGALPEGLEEQELHPEPSEGAARPAGHAGRLLPSALSGGAVIAVPRPLHQAPCRDGPPSIEGFSGGERSRLTLQAGRRHFRPAGPLKVLFEQLMEHQECRREAELAARKCLIGPHRDELRVDIDGRSARQYASQGQTRTAALSLKPGAAGHHL